MQHLGSSGGVISRSIALALGMPSSTLKAWVRDGRLVRVGRGIYVLPGVLENEKTLLRAATNALDAIVSHESAARMHGLDGLDPRRTAVSVPVRHTNKFKGVIVHQSTDLTEDEVLVINGMPVTDPPRTIIDLAAILPRRVLAAVLDQAVRMKLTTYQAVSDRLESTARRGKPGVVKLRRILHVRLIRKFVSESVLETKFIELIRRAGLPIPTMQFRPAWLRKVKGRVDFAYIKLKIIIEVDGMRFHGMPEPFQQDRNRDNVAQLAGWIVLRFTWEDITKRPDYVVETVRQAITKRSKDNNLALEH